MSRENLIMVAALIGWGLFVGVMVTKTQLETKYQSCIQQPK